MGRYKILVIEDEARMRALVCNYLQEKGHEAIPAAGCEEGDRQMQACQPDAVLLDFTLKDGTAIDLLTRWQQLTPLVPVVVLTGHGSIDRAVQTVKLGADQFLTKPADLPSLLLLLERAIENARNRKCQIADKARRNRNGRNPFVGTSSAIRKLADVAYRVAPSESSVLIEGETGTGKGVLARWLHDNSARADEPYMDLNCGGLAASLVESELFGYEKGAFTGAVQTKPGLFEMAHHGTAFLDEIGDMDLQIQPKLLKVLEERQFRRLGEVKTRKIDVRLISATHQNLKQAIQAKTFRSDLYFRINTFTLVTPRLADRAEDIPALADWFLKSFASEFGAGTYEITPEAMSALKGYHWPGNIRELKNVLERATVLADSGVITERELQFPNLPKHEAAAFSGVKTLKEVEREYIERVLAEEQGKVGSAAAKLGIPKSSLYQKLKHYGWNPRPVDA